MLIETTALKKSRLTIIQEAQTYIQSLFLARSHQLHCALYPSLTLLVLPTSLGDTSSSQHRLVLAYSLLTFLSFRLTSKAPQGLICQKESSSLSSSWLSSYFILSLSCGFLEGCHVPIIVCIC